MSAPSRSSKSAKKPRPRTRLERLGWGFGFEGVTPSNSPVARLLRPWRFASLAACGPVDFAGQNLGAWPTAIICAHHGALAGRQALACLRSLALHAAFAHALHACFAPAGLHIIGFADAPRLAQPEKLRQRQAGRHFAVLKSFARVALLRRDLAPKGGFAYSPMAEADAVLRHLGRSPCEETLTTPVGVNTVRQRGAAPAEGR